MIPMDPAAEVIGWCIEAGDHAAASLMFSRRRIGVARYGHPIIPDSRPPAAWTAEAREELADAVCYLVAAGRREDARQVLALLRKIQ